MPFEKVIVDANLSPDFVSEIKAILPDSEIIYVNDRKNKYGFYSSMSDQNIMNIAYGIDAWIITCNFKDFRCYDKVIPLPSKKNVRKLVSETMKYITL